MHTDEYEISLYRELGVCKKAIQGLEKTLSGFENKYNLTTAAFIERYNNEDIGNNSDFTLWNENYESLRRWTERGRQYETMLRLMKI